VLKAADPMVRRDEPRFDSPAAGRQPTTALTAWQAFKTILDPSATTHLVDEASVAAGQLLGAARDGEVFAEHIEASVEQASARASARSPSRPA